MGMLHLYRISNLSKKTQRKLIEKKIVNDNVSVSCEICFNVEFKGDKLDCEQLNKLQRLLSAADCSSIVSLEPHYRSSGKYHVAIEIGPRLHFCTAVSTNALCILRNIGLDTITRFEISNIYNFSSDTNENLIIHKAEISQFLHDKMTEMTYTIPINSFDLSKGSTTISTIDIMSGGIKALEDINKSMGLAMDSWDLSYYFNVFTNVMHRNPTNVECFDLAQSNSEHSRHWFFKGQIILDDTPMTKSLFDILIDTQKFSNKNNVIAFSDNSSAIEGFQVPVLSITDPTRPSVYQIRKTIKHVCFTAETHNFPTGVAPFPGAATGTGGRIRDVQAVGIGGMVVAGSAGYCFGNLRLPTYHLPWESLPDFQYPSNFATASEIIIEASNGASNYGNEFGEPVINGFCRSFGLKTASGDWREWIKPIMFSGGIGQVSSQHIKKFDPVINQLVVKIGGPVYRIGVGGGAASSVEVQGDSERDNELDFGAVQRGDAQMENKLNRVIRGCIDLDHMNPIKSIHDQGAGGNGNVLKELVNPLGADIFASNFTLGDPTINLLELWGAEYQESNGLLIDEKDITQFKKICDRERCPVNVVGKVTGNGCVRLQDFESSQYPVNLDLSVVLGKMPQKKFYLKHSEKILSSLKLPLNLQVEEALARVLRLPSVCSKRFLTNKVDRSVSGLIAQQQCVGPLHTPLADVAVVSLSYYDTVGAASSIGEQPIKILLDAKKGARMCVMEALTNLCMAPVTNLEDVKISGNWMWPAKLSGEGAELWDACNSFCNILKSFHIAVDGGKDSLSMAATVNKNTVVKSPGSLVVSTYVCCPDIRLVVTPDLKGNGTLIWIRMSNELRLGGTALAQAYCQLGDMPPDFNDVPLFQRSWKCLQHLFSKRMVSAAHDISDGGLIGCLLEMAFAGNINSVINIKFPRDSDDFGKVSFELSLLFNEEVGWIIEVSDDHLKDVIHEFSANNLLFSIIGKSGERYSRHPTFSLFVNEACIFNEYKLGNFRMMWEETSYHLEQLQCDLNCVNKEYEYYKDPIITDCPFEVDYSVFEPYENINYKCIRVAILREEGSNGDREMAAAFVKAGFETWDVTMEDLLSDSISLDEFKGLIFVGGFSYGDVLGSAKGWAASIQYNENLRQKFDKFKKRNDTFSLGVCNGCQLLARLGWLFDTYEVDETESEQFVKLKNNDSSRFESRFSVVSIPKETKSIMLMKLKGCRLGVWVSHGEGKFEFSKEIKSSISKMNIQEQIALTYANPDKHHVGDVCYPFNPNGSMMNIAGICSKDGRHLGMMPHPERSFLWWQWPYTGDLKLSNEISPWMYMFTSALEWCEKFDDAFT